MSIWRVKERMWNDYLKNLNETEVYRVARFANLWAGETVEALTDGVGKLSNAITNKEQILTHNSFTLN